VYKAWLFSNALKTQTCPCTTRRAKENLSVAACVHRVKTQRINGKLMARCSLAPCTSACIGGRATAFKQQLRDPSL
jgi:hypothetical protein